MTESNRERAARGGWGLGAVAGVSDPPYAIDGVRGGTYPRADALPAIYGWDRRACDGEGAIPFAVQDAVVELLKQPAPTATQDIAPRLAGDSIRVVGASLPGTGCNLHGARIERTQSGYTLTATSDMRAAVAIHAALGSVVGVPFLGDQGESVVVSLYLNGTTISFSARERDTVGVECDLMRPSGVIFCDTVTL